MFIDGKFVESTTTDWIDLHDPATNEVVSTVKFIMSSNVERMREKEIIKEREI